VLRRPLTLNAIEAGRGPGSPPPDEKESLLAWWKLDQTSGNNAVDASGRGRAAQIKGSHRWLPAPGKLPGALEFDGATAYLDCEDAAEFDVGDRFSVAVWLKASSSGRKENSSQTLLAKGGAWQLTHTSNGTLNFLINGPRIAGNDPARRPWPNLSGKLNLDEERWHHAAATYDGKKVALYIDGEEQSSAVASGPVSLTTAPLTIGGSSSGESLFNGAMADVRLYRRSISAEEVQKLYRAGLQ
jgi:hypothetical protein